MDNSGSLIPSSPQFFICKMDKNNTFLKASLRSQREIGGDMSLELDTINSTPSTCLSSEQTEK